MNILIQNPHCTKRSYESLVGNIVLFWVIFPELFISHASCWNFISSRVRRRKPDTIYHKIASDNLVLPRNLHKSRSNQSSPTKKEDFVRRFPLRLRSDNFWGYIFVGGVELPTVIQLLWSNFEYKLWINVYFSSITCNFIHILWLIICN